MPFCHSLLYHHLHFLTLVHYKENMNSIHISFCSCCANLELLKFYTQVLTSAYGIPYRVYSAAVVEMRLHASQVAQALNLLLRTVL